MLSCLSFVQISVSLLTPAITHFASANVALSKPMVGQSVICCYRYFKWELILTGCINLYSDKMLGDLTSKTKMTLDLTKNSPLLYSHGWPGTVLWLPTDLKPTLHTELVHAITTMDVVGGADAEEPATSKIFWLLYIYIANWIKLLVLVCLESCHLLICASVVVGKNAYWFTVLNMACVWSYIKHRYIPPSIILSIQQVGIYCNNFPPWGV